MTQTSRHHTDHLDTPGRRRPATALRVAAALAVLAILWQGATAGGILMRSRESLEFHEAGAIAVHVLTGLAAIAAFLLWPVVVAVVVFVASFLQAALGDDKTMWAHVPGALVLMLGAAAVLAWAVAPQRTASG